MSASSLHESIDSIDDEHTSVRATPDNIGYTFLNVSLFGLQFFLNVFLSKEHMY